MIAGFLIKSEILKRAAYFIFILGTFLPIATLSSGEEMKKFKVSMSDLLKFTKRLLKYLRH